MKLLLWCIRNKLDGLKEIKKEKRALELEKDSLRGDLEKWKVSKENTKQQKQIVEFYKSEIENYRVMVNDFEDAIKAKNNEIVKVKNQYSKLEREFKISNSKISSLENQLEEYLNNNDESVDEYKYRIGQLEKQVELLRSNWSENSANDRLFILEESNSEKDKEILKNREQIQKLQEINMELEEEIDNLRNELSTLSMSAQNNGEVHRASVEGIKRNQIERDLRKCTQEKIKLDTELQKAKDSIKEFENDKNKRN